MPAALRLHHFAALIAQFTELEVDVGSERGFEANGALVGFHCVIEASHAVRQITDRFLEGRQIGCVQHAAFDGGGGGGECATRQHQRRIVGMQDAHRRMRADAFLEQRLRLIGVVACGGNERRIVEPDRRRRVAFEPCARRGKQLVGARVVAKAECMQCARQLHLRRRLRRLLRDAFEHPRRFQSAPESLIGERQMVQHRRRRVVELRKRFEPADGVIPRPLLERQQAELMACDRIVRRRFHDTPELARRILDHAGLGECEAELERLFSRARAVIVLLVARRLDAGHLHEQTLHGEFVHRLADRKFAKSRALDDGANGPTTVEQVRDFRQFSAQRFGQTGACRVHLEDEVEAWESTFDE